MIINTTQSSSSITSETVPYAMIEHAAETFKIKNGNAIIFSNLLNKANDESELKAIKAQIMHDYKYGSYGPWYGRSFITKAETFLHFTDSCCKGAAAVYAYKIATRNYNNHYDSTTVSTVDLSLDNAIWGVAAYIGSVALSFLLDRYDTLYFSPAHELSLEMTGMFLDRVTELMQPSTGTSLKKIETPNIRVMYNTLNPSDTTSIDTLRF